MEIELQKIKEIVTQAGKMLMKYYNKSLSISYKGPRDLVTEADLSIEQYIKTRLAELYPHYDFLGEESSELIKKESAFILDPLDGTTNFAHRFPFFCISLALILKNEIVLGIIYDPLREELFYAQKGQGAYLNDKRITVSNTSELKKSLLATGFPYRDDTVSKSLSYFNHLLPFCQGIRRAGAAALDLAYTACGRFDGFFELNLKPWDVAAGILIVREAGGVVTDLKGHPSTPFDYNILATNGHIHKDMLNLISKADMFFPDFDTFYRRAVFGKD